MAKKTEPKTKPAAPAKPATKPAAKKKPTATKAKPKAAAKTPKPVKPASPAYTSDDVALRAYFIAEKRRAEGLPGDEHGDWIEAERQLSEEAKKKKPKAKKA